MCPYRSGLRRDLELRVAGLGERVGEPPHGGWIRTMRDALGMSSYQLARRMGFSPTRVRQFEREEVVGTIRLSVLGRAAAALNGQLWYAFVPKEPLDDLVLRQAYFKAAAQLCVWGPDHPQAGDPDLVPRERIDALEHLTLRYMRHRDLWS
jgi:predicted DNA-binding mobile mystery protein A